MKLDNESQRTLGERIALGKQCIELVWGGTPFNEIHPEDLASAAKDAISDILTAVIGAAGSWTPNEEGRLVGMVYDDEADSAATGLLDSAHTSWQGDAEDYARKV